MQLLVFVHHLFEFLEIQGITNFNELLLQDTYRLLLNNMNNDSFEKSVHHRNNDITQPIRQKVSSQFDRYFSAIRFLNLYQSLRKRQYVIFVTHPTSYKEKFCKRTSCLSKSTNKSITPLILPTFPTTPPVGPIFITATE